VNQEQAVELSLPQEELACCGGRDIMLQAIEAEVQTLLDEYTDVQLLDGRQAILSWVARDIASTKSENGSIG
jgi:short-subunit dehydrogenase involved in D-alanine esterification of teichoic acids